MRTRVFIPPVPHYAGGIAVLLELAAHLHQGGRTVHLVPREGQGPFPGRAEQVPVLPWDSLDLTADDFWLVPEGWVNALAPGLNAGARCLVYCQNWAYLLSSLPENVAWGQLPVSFLAVSAPVAWYIRECTGLQADILRPGIDLQRFQPGQKGADALRIAFMPRKNKAMVQRVREIVTARMARGVSPLLQAGVVEWVEISGQSQQQVAATLASCHFFLATGFPEGFALPPLEAMACGCFPVGCSGMGGWDYMRQAAPELPFAAAPWWPQEHGPAGLPQQGGNGIWVADGDAMAAALALEQAVAWQLDNDPRHAQALENGRATAQCYSLQRQQQRCLELWDALAQRA